MDTFGRGLAIPPEVAAVALPLGAGLTITLMLIAAVWLGKRVRAREPGPPRPEDQPHLPETGAVHEISEMREPDEMPHDGTVLLPHELRALGNMGSRRAKNQKPPTWNEGSSGGFGSGGPGHH
ncbi:hypothetical protein FE633_02660 [Streptomyces montanus]|uniref:Secreted protein n=2 Tax=Streptomyces TaxID=1883 RepID=A0A505D523_9ACTN|nr:MULTISPECIES: DUF6479 family protein [Streptomyces]TLS47884.1 hypothetical protein FE633_02660 [Streptomyces montanus]TPQ16805.1 hypothetical protein FGD71_040085 [Streptomyces sporangiiformans]